MALVDFDKFLASFITEMRECSQMRNFSIPRCIKKALEDQGLEYKDGEIVKSQRRVSAEAKENGYGESEDEKVRKALVDALNKNLGNGIEKYGTTFNAALAWLEKQGGQKPSYMFKPKFHKGDFIKHNKANIICKVISVDCGSYYGENIETGDRVELFVAEQSFHLWTIDDVKSSDVLAFDDETIVIFKDLYNATTFHSYCHIEDGLFDVNKDEMPDWWEGKGFHPATKKQRDILFAKMHEAGYTFDFKKKELKKLKFKVGDEIITKNEESLTITKIDEEGYWSNDLFICDFDSECSWDLVEQKSDWGEEDEVRLQACIDTLQAKSIMGKVDTIHINWLKSLKNRIKGE